MVIENAVFCPFLYCDHCNERLTDAGAASVMWPVAHNGAMIKTSCPQYVHNGQCHDAIEAGLLEQSYQIGSEKLHIHLQRLQFSLSPESRTAQTAATDFLADLGSRGIGLVQSGDTLRIQDRDRAITEQDRAAIQQYKPQLLSLLRASL